MNARLIAIAGPLTGSVFALGSAPITVGRHPDNAITIPALAVSRQHCRIDLDGESFRVTDLDSRHGTFVNDKAIKVRQIDSGDRLTLCDSQFLLVREASPLPAGPVRFDDRAFVAQSTLLSFAEGFYRRPEKLAFDDHRTLAVLLRAAAEIGRQQQIEPLARRLLELAREAIPTAERAALLLESLAPQSASAGNNFEATFLEPQDGERLAVSRTITLRVMNERVALLATNVRLDQSLGAAESLQMNQVESLIAVPLVATEERPLGVLYLDRQRRSAPFTEADLRYLTAFAGMAAPALANLRHVSWLSSERRKLRGAELDHQMVGESPALAATIERLARVARADTTVLLRGESGTGKELAARALHRGSRRGDGPFVAINCATLSENLVESELFGHEKGAFTGAVARKAGKLEVASGGTLFLDEVGELPPQVQARLLRVVQERTFERVGGTRPITVDLRLVAATNRDLEEAIRAGTFRQDLFYRLAVITLDLPPLRDRRQDIPLLASHFAALHGRRLGRPTMGFATAARQLMQRYAWPGNVRELSNAVEHALVLATGDIVHPEDLPATLHETAAARSVPTGSYQEALFDTKRRLILHALEEARGNVSAAARALGLHPNYLHRLISNLDLRSTLER